MNSLLEALHNHHSNGDTAAILIDLAALENIPVCADDIRTNALLFKISRLFKYGNEQVRIVSRALKCKWLPLLKSKTSIIDIAHNNNKTPRSYKRRSKGEKREARLDHLREKKRLKLSDSISTSSGLDALTAIQAQNTNTISTITRIVCPICAERSISGITYAAEKGLRDHLNAKHTSLSVVESLEIIASASSLIKEESIRKQLPQIHPVILAAKEGNLLLLKQLLINENVHNIQDQHGSNSLHWAAGNGHLNIVKCLIEDYKFDKESRDSFRHGRTALHWAAMKGHISIIKYLLNLGISVNIPTRDNSIPLHLACYGGHIDTCKLLVESKADLDAKNNFLCGPAHWTALGGHVPVAKWLIKKGVSFNSIQKEGHTPLHKAVLKGKLDMTEYLVHVQPDTIEIQDLAGRKALDIAQLMQKQELINVLQ